MITITSAQIEDIIGYITSIFADLLPVVLFIGGIITGIYILMSLLEKKRENNNDQ